MKTRDWKDIAELIGIAAIVASLIFVGLQMRQEQKIAQAQGYVGGGANYIELSSLILEHQDIWMRGLYDEELSDVERAKFEQLARAWTFRLGTQMSTRNLVGMNNDVMMNSWAYDIYIHPGLRRWFHSYVEHTRLKELQGEEYASTNYGIVEQILAEMDRDSVPIPSQKTYYLRL